MKKSIVCACLGILLAVFAVPAVFAEGEANLFTDPGFETGKLDGWTLTGAPNDTACIVENKSDNAHKGDNSFKYWNAKAFSAVLSRQFDALPNGTYSLKIYASGGGSDKKISISVSGYDGENVQEAVIKNTGWKNWKQYKIEGIEVKDGKCTVSINIDAKNGTWGNFDDIEFIKTN